MVHHLFYLFFPSITRQICLGFSYLNGIYWNGYFRYQSYYLIIAFFDEI